MDVPGRPVDAPPILRIVVFAVETGVEAGAVRAVVPPRSFVSQRAALRRPPTVVVGVPRAELTTLLEAQPVTYPGCALRKVDYCTRVCSIVKEHSIRKLAF